MQRDEFTGNQYTAARELATVATVRAARKWSPAAHRSAALDTRRWSTRSARGLSWQGHGIARASQIGALSGAANQ